jgi:hypothetical protein
LDGPALNGYVLKKKIKSVVTLPPLDNVSWRYEVEVTERDGSGSQTTHEVMMLLWLSVGHG